MEILLSNYTVKLCRWKINYEYESKIYTLYVPSEEEADILLEQYKNYQATKTKLDTTNDEWVDGITVPETSTQPKTDAEKLIALGKEAYFNNIRNQKQNENKFALATWLYEHPLLWTDGKMYGTSQEDQSEMALNLIQYQATVQAGLSATLEWHAQKESCRPFELEEFTSLSLAIAAYVYPYLRYQESVKEKIYAAKTIEEINNVEIDYASI